MYSRYLRALLPAVAVVAVPYVAHAQEVSSIVGTVRDHSGAVVPNARVELSHPQRGSHFQTVTSGEGFYRLTNVPPGPGYVLTVKASGFTAVTITDVYMNVANVRTQDASLTAGADVAIEVSVQNSGVTLNTIDASVGNNLDIRAVDELPVQLRGTVKELFTLQPGVTLSGSVAGARVDQNSVTVDGLDYNDLAAGGAIGNAFGTVSGFPADSVQEFRGTVAGLPINIGTGGGGQYQLVTKSGTNKFHGNINEYHRDAAFAANSWFNNNIGLKRANLIRNQFGGNVGGPVLRDRGYFFFNYYGQRLRNPSSQTRVVPLNSMRSGNLSYIRATNANTNAACAITSRQNTTPACIGILTSTQVQGLDPAGIGNSQNILSFINARYPEANDLTLGDGVNTGGYRFNYVAPDDTDNYILRMDYHLTSKMSIFGRATVQRRNWIDPVQGPPRFPADPVTPYEDRSYSYVFGHIWQIGSNKVNQFVYGDVISKLNFPAPWNATGTSSYSLPVFTSPYASLSSQKRRVPIPEVRDDFNWTLGNHNLNLGGTFKFIKTNSNQVNDFNFVGIGLGGNTLGLSPALRPANIQVSAIAYNGYDQAFTTMLGRVGSISSNYNFDRTGKQLPQGGGATRQYRYYQTELYAGDIWKVTPSLTFDYGVRWMYYSVPYEVNGAESVVNLGFDTYFNARNAQSAAGLSGDSALPFITYNLGGKANHGPDMYSPSYKDFAPRIGFSYSPDFDSKMVFHGSASILYDRTVINAVNFIQDQSSYLFQNTASKSYGAAFDPVGSVRTDPRVGANLSFPTPPVAPAITKPYTPYVDGGVPYGLAYSETGIAIDPHLKDPYNMQYTFGIQRQLPANFVLKMDYVGRQGRRLLAAADASQLIDFTDRASGQKLSTAFANISLQARRGQAVTPQPWFENQVGSGWTNRLVNGLGSIVSNGDFADFVQAMASSSLIDSNIGMPAQISSFTYETNKGFSSYNGLLLTLSKNSSHGIKGDFNYTWSHEIDNVSVPANFIPLNSGYGFLCDVNQPRICRSSGDFDVRHIINANFVWQLPFGRQRRFGTNMPLVLDELIGGWEISGIPQWSSGLPFSPVGSAFVAGYANNAPVIFTGSSPAVYRNHLGKTKSGSLNLYGNDANVSTVAHSFTGPIGFQIGQRNLLRGPGMTQLDMGLAKTFTLVADRDMRLKLRGDAFNVLNHPAFANPANADITSGSFGQITSVSIPARILQVSARVEF